MQQAHVNDGVFSHINNHNHNDIDESHVARTFTLGQADLDMASNSTVC